MKKLLLISFLAFGLFACDKDDDKNEPDPTPKPNFNTELIFMSDTSIKQVYYTDADGNFQFEMITDPELRRWAKKLNYSIGDSINFSGSAVSLQSTAEIEVIYTGEGKLDTLDIISASGSANFEGVIVP